MDLNYEQLGAIGSILGGIGSVASLLGILFAANEIRNARKIVDRETDYRIYEMMLDLDKFFIDNADLRPYLYNNKTLPDDVDKGSVEYERVIAAIELMVDFMECTYMQFDLMPPFQRIGWIDYMVGIAETSPMMREFIENEGEWYTPSFVYMLKTGQIDPRLDKSSGNKKWRQINKAHWRNRLNERFGKRIVLQ